MMSMVVVDRKWKALALFLTVIFIAVTSLTTYAADAKILETNVYNDEIYIFIKGISGVTSDSTVQIGNKVCQPEQISASPFEQMDVFMRTLILIDNSKSIPEKNHAEIQEILKGIVSNAKENEQIKIGTFSREAAYLCDYTSDHVILENIIDSITYKDQDTYLSDVLYNIISELNLENTYICTRIIILSDGADDNYIGYTNDEVRRFIESNPYPIYTIGFPKKNNASQLETMFSFSRAAKTDFFLMDGNTTSENILNTLFTDQNGVCFKLTPDESLKDGSNKSILLKLNTAEGAFEFKTNVDMPFGTVEDIQTEPMSTIQQEPESEAAIPMIIPTPLNKTDEMETKDSSKEAFPFLWIIILLAGVITILIIIFVFFVLLKKKKTSDAPNPVLPPEPEPIEDSTRLGFQPRFDSAPEKELWGNKHLILKNLDVPNIFFNVPITETVSIGRRSTQDIMIDDPEVSREHCKITLRGGLLYLQNYSKSNGTYYENVLVHEGDEVPIVNGGKIKMGQYQYSVELIDN